MRQKRTLIVAALVVALGAMPLVEAETVEFHFANVGQSYSAFLGPSDPLVGMQVVSARIFLDVESFPGSDAANFFTDITFPISPLPGNTNFLGLSGEDLDWSGSGVFHYFEETDRFNGTFVTARYGAETPGFDFDGEILDGSRIEFDYVPEPSALLLLAAGAAALRLR